MHGRDFNVVANTLNRCTLTLLPERTTGVLPAGVAIPAHGDLRFILTTAGPVTAFVNGLHITEGQVDDLTDDLAAIGARISSIEAKIPTTPPTIAAGAGAGGISIPLIDLSGVVPGVWPAAFNADNAFASGTGLPSRGRGLLPAIHDSGITSFTALPLADPAAHKGQVFKNNSGATVTLPGKLGRRESQVAAGAFFASDGRTWYRVTRSTTRVVKVITSSSVANPTVITATAHHLTTGESIVIFSHTGSTPSINGTRVVTVTGANTFTIPLNVTVAGTGGLFVPVVTSFYPADFERELFMFAVSDKMHRAGQILDVKFDLSLATLRADTRAQWLLVIEAGAATQDTAPALTGENLAAITWQAVPLLSQRIVLSAAVPRPSFGVRITRAGNGSFRADKLLYGQYEAADAIPATPNYTLRARLVQFDTENSVTAARGFAYFKFASATAQIS